MPEEAADLSLIHTNSDTILFGFIFLKTYCRNFLSNKRRYMESVDTDEASDHISLNPILKEPKVVR
jgi:hypothetical protein